MTALSAGDIAAMRDTTEGYLPETCSIMRRTVTPDGRGGSAITWATLAAGVPCRLSPQTTRVQAEQVVAGKQSAVTRWTITIAAATAIAVTDRVQIGSRIFDVDTVTARSWELSRRVECVEVV